MSADQLKEIPFVKIEYVLLGPEKFLLLLLSLFIFDVI